MEEVMEPVKKSAEELLKEANKLYGEKKYGEAVALFKSAAEENNAEALYMLGIITSMTNPTRISARLLQAYIFRKRQTSVTPTRSVFRGFAICTE